MTAPKEIPSELDPLLREALAWVVRLHSGDATVADAEALRLWRRSGPHHDEAFRDAVRLWRDLRSVARELVAENEAGQTGLLTAPRAGLSRRGLIGGAVAASVAAGYFVVRPPLGLWPSLQELSADYRTAKGEQRSIALSDDVSLKLNTQTSVAIRAAASEPHIELISGETAISAKGGGRPVLVDASGGRIAALQANFNVRCLDDDVTVCCLEGTVEVGLKGQSVQLGKDEQVSYSPAAGLGAPRPVDPMQSAAWQEGLLIVRDRPLASVVEEVNRYRPGKIVLLNTELRSRMITGTFHLDRLDDFIAQTRVLFGTTVRSLPGGVVLLS
ncbi:MAG TPA: FecR domain-containing protein [Rhodopseudomonas sp.]|uniref:FecR family protein n=1 Tax=Rhodopseudomonas sp. TaxID=1078 RepID=UPI002ED9087C